MGILVVVDDLNILVLVKLLLVEVVHVDVTVSAILGVDFVIAVPVAKEVDGGLEVVICAPALTDPAA